MKLKIGNVSSDLFTKAANLTAQIEALQDELSQLLASGLGSGIGLNGGRGRGKMSAAGRARIVAAQKKRWAKQKRSQKKTGKNSARSLAAKKRWAETKASGKKTL